MLVVFLPLVRDNIAIKLMQKWRLRDYLAALLLVVFALSVTTGTVFAETSNSPNYQVTETEFNAGSTLENCSASYCARASIGDMTAGKATTAGGTATFGSLVDGEPLLEVIVNTGESNLGVLTTEATATKTMIVQIRSYLSGGYVLQIVGTPPKYKDHMLDTPSTPTAADPGTEQFGINAAANTTPSVGAEPVQVPSSQTSFGFVTDDYNTPNLFKYASGDVVGRSLTESGRTDYTISMIVNISNTTPAGHFAGDFSAVVIPVY